MVSDQMAVVDKKLAEEDVSTWLQSVMQIPGQNFREMPLEVVIGYAVNYAQIRRQHFDQYTQVEKRVAQKIGSALGGNALQIAEELGKYYEQLPKLPQEVTEAIPLFEKSAQYTSKTIGFPIVPSLTQVNGDWVWEIDPVQK